MKVIWKYPLGLSLGEPITVIAPRGAVPVRFAMQADNPTVWCLCDPDS